LLVEYLASSIGSVVKQHITADQMHVPLLRMGMDSLIAMELKSRLDRELGVEVALATLIEGPSIRALSALISKQLTATPRAGEATAEPLAVDYGDMVEGEL
jgi:aryl carrier-like protein